MSYYDNDNAWAGQHRQASWEQSTPSRGPGSAPQPQIEPNAFASQFEEIERATDNLMRSGKWYPGGPGGSPSTSGPGRRDSMPAVGRGPEFGQGSDPRMGGNGGHQSRHQSSHSEYDGSRPGSAGLQGYYAGQRFPARQSEAEQMLQAKRRMAAQRERELRNYHQEQQYNRSSSGPKSDRSMSPNTMSEDDRRELIARQHRALYGDNSSLYNADGSSNRSKGDARGSGPGRGSPLAFDQYQSQPGAEGDVQMPPRERPESTTSPANIPSQQSLNVVDSQSNSRTATSSPGATSPPHQSGAKGGNVGAIGTRPSQVGAAALNKRSTTPLTPSSLGYAFNDGGAKDERAASAASNPSISTDKNVMRGNSAWNNNNNNGVWGKNSLGNQASVWG